METKRTPAKKGALPAWIDAQFAAGFTDECLIWPYSQDKKGYGYIREKAPSRRIFLVHRVMWERFNGCLFPTGLVSRHLCGNGIGGCVNPLHVIPGTQAENMADMTAHGTRVRGERVPNAALTEVDVRELRRLYVPHDREFSIYALGRRFGISPMTAYNAIRGKTWKHVNSPSDRDSDHAGPSQPR